MNATHARQLFAAAFTAALFAPSATAQDAGSLTKDKADKVHASKPTYSPYAGRNFPDTAALRRHPPPHRLLDGRRRLRRAAHAPRRLPSRARARS